MKRFEKITISGSHRKVTAPVVSLLRRFFTAGLVLALMLCLPEWVEACPTCKNDLHRSGMEVGFAISILFMIAVPFCIFAAWTIAIVRLTRMPPAAEVDSLLPDRSQQAQ